MDGSDRDQRKRTEEEVEEEKEGGGCVRVLYDGRYRMH